MNCCICGSPVGWGARHSKNLMFGVVEWAEEASYDLGEVCPRCSDEILRSSGDVIAAVRAVVLP